nr:unnamed protein product [Digitaria exilis]
MSGGFFRGTSADQDTRFSNKQAKLLKTQKFAPELDHLVDMSKVKMDVMKPWIAKRVTELLGFEDEVLINFIYGLLEEKAEDDRIAQEIQKKREKEGRDSELEKQKILDGNAGNSTNANGVEEMELDFKRSSRTKNRPIACGACCSVVSM